MNRNLFCAAVLCAKQCSTRICALFLAVALMPFASSQEAYTNLPGVFLRRQTVEICDELFYTSSTFQHSVQGRQEERYFELGSSSSLRPVVVSGNNVYKDLLTISEAAEKLSSQGYQVVGGLTGDMFSTTYGVPLGLSIYDGIIKTCDNGLPAAAFFPDGTVTIGYPALNISLLSDKANIKIDKINRVRDTDKLYLYTHEFGATTHTTKTGKHVVLSVQGDLRLGIPLSGVVKEILTGSDAYPLKAGEMVLSASSTEPIGRLDSLVVGDAITISVSAPDPKWNDALYACGGLNKLITKGISPAGLNNTDRAPRTAVGVRADGSAVFYAVDGRQSGYSNGLTLAQVGERLRSMGCVEAIELDGGGSTAFGIVYPGTSEFKIQNSPSDGQPRKCTNYIFFVINKEPPGPVGRLFPRDQSLTIFKGAQYTFSLTATDKLWHPVAVPTGVNWISDNSSAGIVDQSGRFTAAGAGAALVTASYGDAYGYAEVNVIEKLDAISIYTAGTNTPVTSLTLNPAAVVRLTAGAWHNTMPVVAQNNCFEWVLEGDIGTLTEDGVFTAVNRAGAMGKITVSAGGQKLTIPVSIGKIPALVEDFENGFNSDNPAFRVDVHTKNAARGNKSAEICYILGERGFTLELDLPLKNTPSSLYFYLQGDGSDNIISFTAVDSVGKETPVYAGRLSHTDYQLRHIKLPDDAVGIKRLTVGGPDKAGVIRLDHFFAAWEEKTNSMGPIISFDKVERNLGLLNVSATAQDTGGFFMNKEQITVKLDGEPIEFSYDTAKAQISFTINEPDLDMHVLSIEAFNIFGNRSRASYVMQYPRSQAQNMLQDVNGKWMEPYADFLDFKGVITASEVMGERLFEPLKVLSRLEMVEMIIKLMKVDSDSFGLVSLPFTDADSIPLDKLKYVKAAYSLGLIAGMPNPDGTVKMGWNDVITKQDFCVIAASVLPKAFAGANMTFVDKDDISDYAVKSVEVIVALGSITGNEKHEFCPKKAITRAEAAVILVKLFF